MELFFGLGAIFIIFIIFIIVGKGAWNDTSHNNIKPSKGSPADTDNKDIFAPHKIVLYIVIIFIFFGIIRGLAGA